MQRLNDTATSTHLTGYNSFALSTGLTAEVGFNGICRLVRDENGPLSCCPSRFQPSVADLSILAQKGHILSVSAQDFVEIDALRPNIRRFEKQSERNTAVSLNFFEHNISLCALHRREAKQELFEKSIVLGDILTEHTQ